MPTYFSKHKLTQTNEIIKSILKSGLLLDEDMDYVLIHYREDNYWVDNKTRTFKKFINGISICSTLFCIHKRLTIFMPLAATPILISGLQKFKAYLKNKHRKYDIFVFIKSLRECYKLHRAILRYLKEREETSSTDIVLSLYTSVLNDLFSTIFCEINNLTTTYLNYIKESSTYNPVLARDYNYLEYLKLETSEIFKVDNVADCVEYLKKTFDIFLLVSSNALACLCVSLTFDVALKYDVNIDKILDDLVPKMRTETENYLSLMHNKFDEVRFFYLKQCEIKVSTEKSTTSKSSHLYDSTKQILSESSDIIGKTCIILDRLKKNNLESDKEKEILCSCVLNLRNQVNDFYESLGVLHHLYEININRSKSVITIKESILQRIDSISKIDIIDASLNSVEPTCDEEYELYIGANDFIANNKYIDYEEEESLKYATAINRELKQKLKKHVRFIAARQKRGLGGDFEPQPLQQEEEIDVGEPENACIESESSDERKDDKKEEKEKRKSRSLPITPRPAGDEPDPQIVDPIIPAGAVPEAAGPSGAPAPQNPGDPVAGPSNEENQEQQEQQGGAQQQRAPVRPVHLGPYGDVVNSVLNSGDFLERMRVLKSERSQEEVVYQIDLTNEDDDIA